MKKIFAFLALALIATTTFAEGLNDLPGLYQGTIKLWENDRIVPLQVVLNVLESANPGTEELLTIVGSFTVDDEGGPYTFSNITLAIEDGRIDMRYTRPNRTRILNTPSHFRLVGHLQQGNPLQISGTVLSGFYGPMGEFSVKHQSGVTALLSQPKNLGHWLGTAHLRDSSGSFEIVLAPSGAPTINPEGFEFDFTNGVVGSFWYQGVEIPLHAVYIDYLRGKLFLVNGSPDAGATVTLETVRDPLTGALSGTLNSSLQGRNGTFKVEPTK